MLYINQKYFVKFNKIFFDQNKIFKNQIKSDEFLTVEVEDSKKFTNIQMKKQWKIIYKYINMIRCILYQCQNICLQEKRMNIFYH